ncbi:hypothetical protein T484DRAFT_3638747 [Baffinella frigidus]|nr:hypothetical protein T484DRAFT_3638747 [Cryptophyta sp. CCMP2293]
MNPPTRIQNPKPETRNPKPETRNMKPETLNTEPETLNAGTREPDITRGFLWNPARVEPPGRISKGSTTQGSHLGQLASASA